MVDLGVVPVRLDKRGTRPRARRDRRYDWAYLFGAACPQPRVAAGLVMPAANAEAMSLHLAAIGRKVAAGSHAALVLDGAGYHIAAALTIPENVTLVRLPPYAPELNPIENVWEYLRGNKLAITVFDDYNDIVDKTCDAWNFFEQRSIAHRINYHPSMGNSQSLGPSVLRTDHPIAIVEQI